MQTTSASHSHISTEPTNAVVSPATEKSNRFTFREERSDSFEDSQRHSLKTKTTAQHPAIKTHQGLKKLDIHQEIAGRAPELVAALEIDAVALTKHIRCPFSEHEDRHPSFRIDATNGRFYCSCTHRGGSIVDLVMRLHRHNDARSAIGWIRAQLNRMTAPVDYDTKIGSGRMDCAKTVPALSASKPSPSIFQPNFNAVLTQYDPANCSPGSVHPYARRKSILPIGALHDPKTNRLVLRIHDVSGRTRGIQFIDVAGEKRFARGSKLTGNGLLLGECRPGTQLGLCEGWATGVAIHGRLGIPVVVAFSANNLMAAACAFSALSCPIVVFGENDIHGEGQRQACKAADKVNGGLWLPPSDFLGDFNDFASPFAGQRSLTPYLSASA